MNLPSDIQPPTEETIVELERARDRQLDAIKKQYDQRIEMLSKERDMRIESVERSFDHQMKSMRNIMSTPRDKADYKKH